MSIYFDEITDLQIKIMLFVAEWVRKEKIPVPQREIVLQMKVEGVKDFTTINALTFLIKKGYIRRAVGTTNKTSYVQLRGVSTL